MDHFQSKKDFSNCIPLGKLISGRFVQRDNRFRVQVEVNGRTTAAHLPNSGRLGELLVPGRKVWLRPAPPGSQRKTAFTLSLVEYQHQLVSVNAHLPGDLAALALAKKLIPELSGYPAVRREVSLGASRIDFWLGEHSTRPPCWLEVKSVTLVEHGTALFPDAPTARGRRHLEELIAAVSAGDRAAVLFVVQRPDAAAFRPHPTADPAFAQTLRGAAAAGVEVYALRCQVTTQFIRPLDLIPARLVAGQ